MRKELLFFAGLSCLVACNQPAENNSTTSSAPTFSLEGKKVLVYTTADSGNLRLTPTDTLTFKDLAQPVETDVCVFVDPSKTFQTLLGIGGALTDASAETFAKLPKDRQQEFLTAYYDPQKGIGYTLGRTNIHSCDFSSDSYTYVADHDSTLQSFNVEHDEKFRIPFIKGAIAAAGGKLTLFSSPWSPPGWMKTNNEMLHGGKLKPEYYQTWADYMVKFIKTYEKEGIPIWGTTMQNEPMATQKWESCIYTAEDERDFLKKYLGPTFEKEGLGDKKIIVWDHNRDLIYQQASTILRDPDAAKYAWGVAFHWYEDWSGGSQVFDNVQRVHESFPDKNLMLTEGCNGPFSMDSVHNWNLGERYGSSMIHDFNNGTVGWTDWNVLLDEQGGPNHVQNFCFAPVHAVTKTGHLIYTSAYYYIGHFSKFIRPGAKRVISSASRSPFLTTAFLNENGQLVVVVMNQTGKKIPYKLWITGKAAELTSLPHSIATLVL
jgi:glucosylceramidase